MSNFRMPQSFIIFDIQSSSIFFFFVLRQWLCIVLGVCNDTAKLIISINIVFFHKIYFIHCRFKRVIKGRDCCNFVEHRFSIPRNLTALTLTFSTKQKKKNILDLFSRLARSCARNLNWLTSHHYFLPVYTILANSCRIEECGVSGIDRPPAFNSRSIVARSSCVESSLRLCDTFSSLSTT